MDALPLLLAATFLAGLTQGVVGFAFGLFTMAVLPLALPLRLAVAVVAVLGLGVNLAVLWRFRRHLVRRQVVPLLGGAFLGAPLGVHLLATVDARIVTAALGAVLTAYAALLLAREGASPGTGEPRVSERWGWPAGLLGGMLGAALNVGGPPAIVYATARRWSPGAFRANLQLFFTLVTVLQLALLGTRGLLTAESGRLVLVALPAVLAGVFAGFALSRRIDAATFRRLVLWVLLLLGASYLARAVGAA